MSLRRGVGGAGRSERGEPDDSILNKHGPADRPRSSYMRAVLVVEASNGDRHSNHGCLSSPVKQHKISTTGRLASPLPSASSYVASFVVPNTLLEEPSGLDIFRRRVMSLRGVQHASRTAGRTVRRRAVRMWQT